MPPAGCGAAKKPPVGRAGRGGKWAPRSTRGEVVAETVARVWVVIVGGEVAGDLVMVGARAGVPASRADMAVMMMHRVVRRVAGRVAGRTAVW